jgi:GrpB-like predicted nucleotidyltransferase (UPF0157 family)
VSIRESKAAQRDEQLANPAWRDEYRQLKVELAERYKNDRAKYSESKGMFVSRVIQEWRNRGRF